MKKKKVQFVSETTKKKLMLKGSDFCLDLSKLIFGGIILGGLMGLSSDLVSLLVWGIISLCVLISVSVGLFIFGNRYNKS